MKSDGFNVSALYGDLNEPQKDSILKEFLSGATRVLILTDLLKGTDFKHVDLFINYEEPIFKDGYMCRIGRDNRLEEGYRIAITLVWRFIKEVEDTHGIEIKELPKDLKSLYWDTIKRLSYKYTYGL